MGNEHDGRDRSGERNGEADDPVMAQCLTYVCDKCRRVTLDEGPVRGELHAESIADMVKAAARLDDDDAHGASR